MNISEQRTAPLSLENTPIIKLGLNNPNILIQPDQDVLRILIDHTIPRVKIGNAYTNGQEISGIANNIILPSLPDVSALPDQGIVLVFNYNTLGRVSKTFITPPPKDGLTFLGIDYDRSTIPPEHDSSRPRSYSLNSCFQFGGFYLRITSEEGMPFLEMQSIESSLQNKETEITKLNVRKGLNPTR